MDLVQCQKCGVFYLDHDYQNNDILPFIVTSVDVSGVGLTDIKLCCECRKSFKTFFEKYMKGELK